MVFFVAALDFDLDRANGYSFTLEKSFLQQLSKSKGITSNLLLVSCNPCFAL